MAKTLPRGLRNNNPGNLIRTDIPWKGKVPHSQSTDKRFEQFESMAYGIRAMLLDLRGDIASKGLNTVEKLITSYSPPSENKTAAYIAHVCAALKVKADDVLQATPATLAKLAAVICKVENGFELQASDLAAGLSMVVGGTAPSKKASPPSPDPSSTASAPPERPQQQPQP